MPSGSPRVLVKCEPDRRGKIRGHRHTMLDDTDINAQRHIRGAVAGLVAGVIGDGRIFVSGGAEHQGPDGGGLIAVIASQEGAADADRHRRRRRRRMRDGAPASQLDGVEVICLERVARDDHSEAGTGLNVGPNAVKALRVVDPELADAHHAGELRLGQLAYFAHRRHCAVRSAAQGRRRRSGLAHPLVGALSRAARGGRRRRVHYGCEITGNRARRRRSAQDHDRMAQDGSAHRLDNIDLLIAADGRYSGVRRDYFRRAARCGRRASRSSRVLVPDTSDGLIDDYEQWFNGPNRLLAFRVPPGHIYIACAFPIEPDADIPPKLKTPDALRAAYTPANAPPSDQARWIIDQSATMSPTRIGRGCRSMTHCIVPPTATCFISATPLMAWCRRSGRGRRRRSRMPPLPRR